MFFIDDNEEIGDTISILVLTGLPASVRFLMGSVRFLMGFGVNAVQVITFIGFIAEKFHLEFSFLIDDNDGGGDTASLIPPWRLPLTWDVVARVSGVNDGMGLGMLTDLTDLVTFIGFIAEKFHLEFSFLIDDDDWERLTNAAVVTGVVQAIHSIQGKGFVGGVGFLMFAEKFFRTDGARVGLFTDDERIIFQVLVHI